MKIVRIQRQLLIRRLQQQELLSRHAELEALGLAVHARALRIAFVVMNMSLEGHELLRDFRISLRGTGGFGFSAVIEEIAPL